MGDHRRAVTGTRWAITAIIFVFSAAPTWAAPTKIPYLRVVGKSAIIPIDRQLSDLLVVDGRVELKGVVRGHVYGVDSEILVGSTAIVLKSITLNRGSLRLEAGGGIAAGH